MYVYFPRLQMEKLLPRENLTMRSHTRVLDPSVASPPFSLRHRHRRRHRHLVRDVSHSGREEEGGGGSSHLRNLDKVVQRTVASAERETATVEMNGEAIYTVINAMFLCTFDGDIQQIPNIYFADFDINLDSTGYTSAVVGRGSAARGTR